jgi:hypothetical protein
MTALRDDDGFLAAKFNHFKKLDLQDSSNKIQAKFIGASLSISTILRQ